MQIVPWAQQQFQAELAQRPDDTIRLTRLCMLAALEEEAAAHAERGDGGGDSAEPRCTVGSSADWSLQRLDALAAEALAHFVGSSSQPGTSSSGDGQGAGSREAAGSAPGSGAGLPSAHQAEQLQAAPLRVMTSINYVLFERHGYRPCNRYGEPRCVAVGGHQSRTGLWPSAAGGDGVCGLWTADSGRQAEGNARN
jgi:hypothetical protein